MKKYVIDQILFLAAGVIIILSIPRLFDFNKIFIFILEIVTMLSWGYLCRHILTFPLDLVFGKKEENVYFSGVSNIDNYEFFRNKYYCEWEFYSSKGTLEVLVPVTLTEKEIYNMEKPKVDQKVRISFYRFSKILYSWEVL